MAGHAAGAPHGGDRRRLRVLHVTEASGGGIITSVAAMVRATPEIDHYTLDLAMRRHNGTFDVAGAESIRPHTRHLPHRELRRALDHVRPDWVHLHSSIAGALGRVVLSPRRVRTVYTPHCYASENLSLSRSTRALVQRTERALSGRTAAVFAVSDREAALARSFVGSRHVQVVAGFNPMTSPAARPRNPSGTPMSVVTIGRVTDQKDPAFLLTLKERVDEESRDDFRWTWIGSGSDAMSARLEAAGVRVTGWLPQSEVARELDSADVYVHTAAWEGFPMSVTEVAPRGLPMVIRRVDALPSALSAFTEVGHGAMARRLSRLRDTAAYTAESAASLALAAEHSEERLGQILYGLYGGGAW